MIVFDELTDVVSVYVDGTRAERARPAPIDSHILLELDASGGVVGVEVMRASDLARNRWAEHPDRSVVPTDLLSELDRWLAHRWADHPS